MCGRLFGLNQRSSECPTREERGMAAPTTTTTGPSLMQRRKTQEGGATRVRNSAITRCVHHVPSFAKVPQSDVDGGVGCFPAIKNHRASSQPSLSWLSEALRAEVKHLTLVTNRLSQRLDDVKREISKSGGMDELNVASLLVSSPRSEMAMKGSSGSQKRNHPQDENDEELPLNLPVTTPVAERDENILTSLKLFQYTPQSEISQNVADRRVKDRKGERRNAAAPEVSSTQGHLATPMLDGPLVVELHNSTGTDDETSRNKGVVGTQKYDPSKQALLHVQLASVEEDLNRYISDILSLQRDIFSAQNQGITDPNDSSFCNIRQMVQEELNACGNRVSSLAFLKGLFSGRRDFNVDVF